MGRRIPYIDRLICPACVEAEDREAEEAERRRQAAWREQQEREQRRWLLQASNINGRFLRATFDAYRPPNAYAERALADCRELAERIACGQEARGGLILIGPPGVGKTHLACAMALHVIEHGLKRAAVFTTREIVRRLRSTWARGADLTEDQVLQSFDDLALLAIDEVGVGFGSEAETTQLLEVIDRRYRLERPTVIASNLPLAEIRDAIGGRAFDRIQEGAPVVVMQWQSHRQETAP